MEHELYPGTVACGQMHQVKNLTREPVLFDEVGLCKKVEGKANRKAKKQK
jgi:hypothetical protein